MSNIRLKFVELMNKLAAGESSSTSLNNELQDLRAQTAGKFHLVMSSCFSAGIMVSYWLSYYPMNDCTAQSRS